MTSVVRLVVRRLETMFDNLTTPITIDNEQNGMNHVRAYQISSWAPHARCRSFKDYGQFKLH